MGISELRFWLLLAALLVGPSLAIAHGFDHPLGDRHADHACLSCAHGQPGSALPPMNAVGCVAVTPPPPPPVAANAITHGSRAVIYRSRAPPAPLV